MTDLSLSIYFCRTQLVTLFEWFPVVSAIFFSSVDLIRYSRLFTVSVVCSIYVSFIVFVSRWKRKMRTGQVKLTLKIEFSLRSPLSNTKILVNSLSLFMSFTYTSLPLFLPWSCTFVYSFEIYKSDQLWRCSYPCLEYRCDFSDFPI